jgi:hypothetical protein
MLAPVPTSLASVGTRENTRYFPIALSINVQPAEQAEGYDGSIDAISINIVMTLWISLNQFQRLYKDRCSFKQSNIGPTHDNKSIENCTHASSETSIA